MLELIERANCKTSDTHSRYDAVEHDFDFLVDDALCYNGYGANALLLAVDHGGLVPYGGVVSQAHLLPAEEFKVFQLCCTTLARCGPGRIIHLGFLDELLDFGQVLELELCPFVFAVGCRGLRKARCTLWSLGHGG